MAIVNALKFDAHSGAMVADEESWHLRRRKTYFTDPLRILLDGKSGPVCAGFGGVGDPNYHHEVLLRARRTLEKTPPQTAEETGRIFLEAMHGASRRIVDDRLRFLFGFGIDDLNRGRFTEGEETFEIANASLRKRAREIVEGKERPGGRDLVPPNQVCLMATDPEGGFRMFCLKETDGVLSHNAGGFESLGPGKYAGAMRLTGALGDRTLERRREGVGKREGMRILLESILDAMDHFSMVGGPIHILILDDRLGPASRLRKVTADRALLATEVTKGMRGGFVGREEAEDLLHEIVFAGANLKDMERRLFRSASDGEGLDLFLRGYK